MADVLVAEEAAATATSRPLEIVNAWHNFTLWTTQHLGIAMNISRLAPSLEDLVWAGPRMVMKLGKFGGSFISFPDAIDVFGQRVSSSLADPNMFAMESSSSAVPMAQIESFVESVSFSSPSSVVSAAAAAATATQDQSSSNSGFSLESSRGIGTFFSYATSKWALCCVAMAVIINRTHVFAATRRRLVLRWPLRSLLRIGPIVLLLIQVRSLLQSIQCQTSPDFAQLRWGNANKSSELMFAFPNSVLNQLSSALLLGASDQESCRSVRMIPWDSHQQPELVGSLSKLWPLFATFCFSQFVEVLSCVLQGRPVAAETGMTLFEHSLAFAEAEAAVGNQLGWSLFTNKSTISQGSSLGGSAVALTRSMIMKRVNTSPEVLFVAFISAMSHITSHILGIFNLQSKFRLISTGFWGLCFMAGIFLSALNFSLDDPSAQGLLRFPTVCIVGFIPHILVLAGIWACAVVYVTALLLSALAMPSSGEDGHRLSLRQRLVRAHANMQTNISLSDIRIRTDMDFYSALLRAGFGAITMASEAVYLNEDRCVELKRCTWLEEDRLREMEEMRMQWIAGGVPGSRFDEVGAIGLVPIKNGQANATSGYARERAAQQIPKNNASGRRIRDGVGASERSSRWLMAVEYVLHVGRLLIVTWALCTVKILTVFGVRTPPRWLQGLSQRPKPESREKRRSGRRERGLNVDVLSPGEGKSFITIPRTDQVDVEAELRRHMVPNSADATNQNNPPIDEEEVDFKLYSYFLRGGWWGANDSSGDYVPPSPQGTDINDPDFDTTSVVSTTETTIDSELDWESDHGDNDALDDGQRTPTQRDHVPLSFAEALVSARASRESTPVVDTPISPADLARLLNPQSPEDREEARTLAAHLTSDGIMTRSRFRQYLQRQRAQILLTGNYSYLSQPSQSNRKPIIVEKMTPEEEACRLEELLLSRRRAAAAAKASVSKETAGSSWATGAEGLGPDGPQCVVCQSAPRTIIVWPCRCLSLCDDCRVSLAMNNFDKCVCCRRDVISFSRIYVP